METIFVEDKVRAINDRLNALQPINHKNIDFTNPYYTQPRFTPKSGTVSHFLSALHGTSIQHVYIHVPFCMTNCLYCHYPKTVGSHSPETQARFLDNLEREIMFYREKFDFSELKTVHIGGGTPNILDGSQFERLLRLTTANYRPGEEFAVEVYPALGILSEERLALMKQYGVDRVSIGIQTFNDAVNEQNRRLQQPAVVSKELVRLATKYFANVSIDLLYGQKGQALSMLMEDLESADVLGVNSIYLYQTRELIKNRTLELQRALNSFLTFYRNRGYDIVSFDQAIRKRNSDGFCAHRSGRSKGEKLLGMGPGAVSEIDPYIFRTVSPLEYDACGDNAIDPTSVVEKSPETLRHEFFNRSLRHFNRADVNGLLYRDYLDRFGTNIDDDLGDKVSLLAEEGLITVGDDRIEITDIGMLFTQQINYLLLEHFK